MGNAAISTHWSVFLDTICEGQAFGTIEPELITALETVQLSIAYDSKGFIHQALPISKGVSLSNSHMPDHCKIFSCNHSLDYNWDGFGRDTKRTLSWDLGSPLQRLLNFDTVEYWTRPISDNRF